MKKNIGIVLLGTCLLLSACGSSDSSYQTEIATNDMVSMKAYDNYYYDYSYGDYESAEAYDESDSYSQSEADIVKQNMMIARDARVNVDVQNLEEFDYNIQKKVSEVGGYYESSELNDYTTSYSEERYGYFTVRVPADKLDDFLGTVGDSGNITTKNISAEDVSLQYVDVEAHISALNNGKEAFERLMDSAYTVQDIMDVQDRITNIQAQLDSYERQRRVLESRVSYSKVDITAVERRDLDHPVREAFSIKFGERLLDGVESAVELAVNIIVAIPSILVLGVFIVIAVIIVKKIVRALKHDKISFKKKDKKEVKTENEQKTEN